MIEQKFGEVIMLIHKLNKIIGETKETLFYKAKALNKMGKYDTAKKEIL